MSGVLCACAPSCSSGLHWHGQDAPGWGWERGLLPVLAPAQPGLPEEDSGGKKKEEKKRKEAGGCPSKSEIVPLIAEAASLVLCWSPGQTPQLLLDSFPNQFPPFGSSQQELPPS